MCNPLAVSSVCHVFGAVRSVSRLLLKTKLIPLPRPRCMLQGWLEILFYARLPNDSSPTSSLPIPPRALWLLPSSQMAMASCHATQRPLPWQARKAWMCRRRCWIPLLLEMRARFLSFHAGDFMHALHCTKLVTTKVSRSHQQRNYVYRFKSISWIYRYLLVWHLVWWYTTISMIQMYLGCKRTNI